MRRAISWPRRFLPKLSNKLGLGASRVVGLLLFVSHQRAQSIFLSFPPPSALAMARSTRQSSRVAATKSSSATPTTVMSPMFSADASNQSDTPETSDVEVIDTKKRPARARKTPAAATKKRARESDGEADATNGDAARPPAKKRNVRRTAYVEVSSRKSTPVVSKVSLRALLSLPCAEAACRRTKARPAPRHRQLLMTMTTTRKLSLILRMKVSNMMSRLRSMSLTTVAPNSSCRKTTTFQLLRAVKSGRKSCASMPKFSRKKKASTPKRCS